MVNKRTVAKYIKQFSVLTDSNFDCLKVSQQLYSCFLHAFRNIITPDDYTILREYQERIFNLVESMRELKTTEISVILTYLNSKDCCMGDIVIMSWCLPRCGKFLSKNGYLKEYKKNIAQYQQKIATLITHNVVKNFCIETLTKTNNIPTHCLEYLWYYMDEHSVFIFDFFDNQYGEYVLIDYSEVEQDSDLPIMMFNMYYILMLGVGNIRYAQKNTLVQFIQFFISNIDNVKEINISPNGKIFRKQIKNIINDKLLIVPAEIEKLCTDVDQLLINQSIS